MSIMKYCLKLVLVLLVLSLFSCGNNVQTQINTLTIAPVVLQNQTEDVSNRLDLLKDLGFNTVLFIGSLNSSWTDLTIQAQGRGLFALFMVDGTDPSLIIDYIGSIGVDAKIDGIWLSQGNRFKQQDLRKIQKVLVSVQRAVKDRSVLARLFVQSGDGNMISLLHDSKLVPGLIYFDHSAAGLLGLAMRAGTEETPVQSLGADIVKMYNWRNFYNKTTNLLVPLAMNFSYAYADPALFPVVTALMTSMSGPVYLPVALNTMDKTLYSNDLAVVKNNLTLRRQHPSLYQGEHSNLAYSNGVHIDLKESSQERILFTCNFNSTSVRYRLHYLDRYDFTGKILRNLADNRQVSLTSNDLDLNLQPYEFGFWIIE